MKKLTQKSKKIMRINSLHNWNVDTQTAKAIQLKFQKKIVLQTLQKPIRYIAGADVSYSRKLNKCFSAVTIFNYPDMEIVEQKVSSKTVEFPYIPGYLTFREAPVLLSAFEKLQIKPDLILFDGQGIAHPCQMGIASHLGLFLNLPSVGCAKSRLVGIYENPRIERWSQSDLFYKNKKIGKVVRTRSGVKPVFVSPGYGITIEEASEWILKTSIKYRIPEPIRQSHITVNRLRLEFENRDFE